MLFSDLALEATNETCVIKINDKELEVKKYLPIAEKLNFISSVLNNSADEHNFANPVLVEIFFNIELVRNYAGIEFTDEELSNIGELYDTLEKCGVFKEVIAAIGEEEYNLLLDWTGETIDAFYNYQNSVQGIMERVSANYKDLSGESKEIADNLQNPENLELLKNILAINNIG